MKTCRLAALVWMLMLAGTASAAEYTSDQFRCQGHHLVEAGASMYEVRRLCGNPDEVVVTGETPSEAVWIYDLGRNDYIYYLKFSQGALRLVVHRGERGFK